MSETSPATSQQAVREASLPEPWLSAYLASSQARAEWLSQLDGLRQKADERKEVLLQLAEQDRQPVGQQEADEDDRDINNLPIKPTGAPKWQPLEPLGEYHLPGLEALAPPSVWDQRQVDPGIIDQQRQSLQSTLDSFGVDATVLNATVGPRVTQFKVRPGSGVRVETIESLNKNLSLSLSVSGLRIEAPIPGEPFVGIEFPNGNEAPIQLRNLLESEAWTTSEASIPLAVGVDINGRNLVLDLARAPHLLIAGATGSGKSVCMNNFILSLLYRFRPDELEMVLIDPKQVEFAPYGNLPHLIHPVASDPKEVALILQWVVREMEQRYTLMAERKVRHVTSYNRLAEKEGFAKIPWMVVIIDELADLMMIARDKVETSIARIAQLSRAVGIHTILATQRPSVNVITGIIKANYPCRIAFRVSSGIDSRTILDAQGSETLQGRGDMLFLPPGAFRLLRAQSPMVDDAEIEKVVNQCAQQSPPRFRVELPAEEVDGEAGSGEEFEGGADPLLRQALEIVVTNGRATTSFLQRKLKVGYNRASNLIENLKPEVT
ncbi:MAG: DNA translocase FtsK [Verrucomicrobia bacterium]|nr:DNA translocase FtsK [Verrucomicrobiota bacterium]